MNSTNLVFTSLYTTDSGSTYDSVSASRFTAYCSLHFAGLTKECRLRSLNVRYMDSDSQVE